MKICENTMTILKNYASINESIIFHPGNILNTVTSAKNVMSFAEVTETFPITAAIYNLNQLINTLGLFDDPDVEFKDTYLIISDDNNTVKYYYGDDSIINIANTVPKMPDNILEFVLSKDDLSALNKASSVLNLQDLILTPNGDELVLSVTNVDDKTSNSFSRQVGQNTLTGDFNFNFKADTLRLIPGDYTVTIAGKDKRYISKFVKTDNSITYYIALDPASKQF